MIIVPEEIINALKKPYGYILLVKGKAGTGKTTLALEILGLMENPIYVSTRITPNLLFTQFPWLKEVITEENIIDATTFDLDQMISKEQEPEILKGIQLQSLPDFVRILFSKINSAQSGTLVIDSWDAIATLSETNWGKPTKLLANYISELIRQKNFNLILIEETEQETSLDYLVDAIVILSRHFIEDNRTMRKIQINKLRGIPINYPSYLFTLHNGRFTTLLPTPIHDLAPSEKIEIIENQTNRYSTGIPDLDKVLAGGFLPGTVTLSTTHTYLGFVHAQIILRIAFQFLKQKRGVIAIPPPGRSYADYADFTRKVVGNETFKKCFRHVVVGEEDTKTYTVNLNSSSNKEFFDSVLDLSKNLQKSCLNKPNWILISLDNLKFGMQEFTKEFLLFINRMKKTNDIIFLTAYSDNPLIKVIQGEVYNHFSLTEAVGKAIYYPKNLRTNLFALNFKNPENKYQIDLIPLV